jgi:hypothetical protein
MLESVLQACVVYSTDDILLVLRLFLLYSLKSSQVFVAGRSKAISVNVTCPICCLFSKTFCGYLLSKSSWKISLNSERPRCLGWWQVHRESWGTPSAQTLPNLSFVCQVFYTLDVSQYAIGADESENFYHCINKALQTREPLLMRQLAG